MPQTRSLGWAVSPAAEHRVGLIAYGVGIVECLEPMQAFLEGGAEVRLVYGSRDTKQTIHLPVIRRLLAEYPSRFSVRLCLSREDQLQREDLGAELAEDKLHQCAAERENEAQCTASAAVKHYDGRIRVTHGRIQAQTLSEEFLGAYSGSLWGGSAYYLAVGMCSSQLFELVWSRLNLALVLGCRSLQAPAKWSAPRTIGLQAMG